MSTTEQAGTGNPGGKKVLATMLERLFASIAGGPSLNCRPHNSRQRVDWSQLSKLGHVGPDAALAGLLGGDMESRVLGKVVPPREVGDDAELTEPQRAEHERARRAWSDLPSRLQGCAPTRARSLGIELLFPQQPFAE